MVLIDHHDDFDDSDHGLSLINIDTIYLYVAY